MTNLSSEAIAAQSATEHDAINQLAGLAADVPLARLREQRSKVLRHAQGSYLALLQPEEYGNLGSAERDLIALRVAVLTSNQALAEAHRQRLLAAGSSHEELRAIEQFPAGGELSERHAVLLRHVDRVSHEPRETTRADIEALQAVGFDARDIVTAAQWIAFLSFQVRTLAGLRILEEEQHEHI